ncbi:hypothetical protein CERZMDRAFT_99155 [Cercospora zeae-maydis SCOH1-5]|uniref:Uncharacterized protein n=1 Tax=Cercospora zeae-maydis SCOH1-5 TaxID=717836 RepID=A0A6A6FB15_9PEZI|nr:hypothetical protein CERZMDRAFT_99155 [Cercospora zeae-maydis SCOH1-5]
MHAFSIATTAIALAGSALASPAAEPVSLSTRANSKLNQYSNPNCLDNNGPCPSTAKAGCWNKISKNAQLISDDMGQGPWTQVWAYSKAGCTGPSTNLVGGNDCVPVSINNSNEFQNVLSIMMD